jgi:MFS-type transporter involved in bile tolerance (Atg22 family)
MAPSYARSADTDGVTRFRFLQVAFTCLTLFALIFVLGAILDSTWLRVASLPLLFIAGFAHYIRLWWGEHRILLAIGGGLILTMLAAGFIAQLVS